MRTGNNSALRGARHASTRALAAVLGLLLPAVLAGGCDGPSSGERKERGPASQDARGGLFESVSENLDRLEQFEPTQMLSQICERLNQWVQQEKPKSAWQLDPLVKALPPDLQKLPVVNAVDVMKYRLSDGWFLQESIWMRDISKTARRDQFEDLAVAQLLFDWTVRNIQLESDEAGKARPLGRRPFEALLLGRGTAIDRDWIFISLARQQGLDVVLLALADADGKNQRPWATALLANDELYLFDSKLGLPIPGPDGTGVATLKQVVADPNLLRQLDLDAEHPYPVKADDLKHVVALIEGNPQNLSHRMALVESRLAGKHKTVLTSPGSALAERLQKVPQLAEVKLWTYPFEIWKRQATLDDKQKETLAREMVLFQVMPNLAKGRALYFKGLYDGEQGANRCFLEARPSNKMIADLHLTHEEAQHYRPEDISRVEAARTLMAQQAKQNASFWLGEAAFAQDDYPSAIDWFGKRTAAGPYTTAAPYNLGRAYEASGELDRAIAIYEADTSAQSYGNKLRARALKSRLAAEKKPADSPPSP